MYTDMPRGPVCGINASVSSHLSFTLFVFFSSLFHIELFLDFLCSDLGVFFFPWLYTFVNKARPSLCYSVVDVPDCADSVLSKQYFQTS